MLADIHEFIEERGGFIRFTPNIVDGKVTPGNLPVVSVSKDKYTCEEYRLEAIRINCNDEVEVFCDNVAFRETCWMSWTDDNMKSLEAYDRPWHCLDAESMPQSYETNLYSIYLHLLENVA